MGLASTPSPENCCTRRRTATQIPYVGKRVLVVGSGASGMDIAGDLVKGRAAKVWLAVRTPPNILLRSLPWGIPGDVVLRPMFHLSPSVADAILWFLRSLSLGRSLRIWVAHYPRRVPSPRLTGAASRRQSSTWM